MVYRLCYVGPGDPNNVVAGPDKWLNRYLASDRAPVDLLAYIMRGPGDKNGPLKHMLAEPVPGSRGALRHRRPRGPQNDNPSLLI